MLVSIGDFRSSSDKDPIVCQELYGFTDAVKSGFGACVYVRSFCRSGKVNVRLLTAKSWVALLKTETIPRLELLGNLLLLRLITSEKNAFKNCFNLFMDRLESNFEQDKGYQQGV